MYLVGSRDVCHRERSKLFCKKYYAGERPILITLKTSVVIPRQHFLAFSKFRRIIIQILYLRQRLQEQEEQLANSVRQSRRPAVDAGRKFSSQQAKSPVTPNPVIELLFKQHVLGELKVCPFLSPGQQDPHLSAAARARGAGEDLGAGGD